MLCSYFVGSGMSEPLLLTDAKSHVLAYYSINSVNNCL